MADIDSNLLYFGDNLDWLQDRDAFPDESVDLVYLDPPFNSKRDYNVLFRQSDIQESEAQIHAFEDTWSWDREGRVQEVFNRFWDTAPEKPALMLKALIDALGHNDVTAYLTMMAPRLVELHRVLKPTGSLYLHCDPTASHYLKIILDSIFSPRQFRNEIIWRRTGSHNSGRRFGPIHDTILYYAKTAHYTWNPIKRPYMAGHVEEHFILDENGYRTNYYGNVLTGSGTRQGESGRPWRGIDPTPKGRHWAIPKSIVEECGEDLSDLGQHEKLDRLLELGFIKIDPSSYWPIYEHYVGESDGQLVGDIWAYQPYTSGTVFQSNESIDEDVRWLPPRDPERLGYPTQKPIGLLERIIKASSNPGDVVLDPFCGCGTAVHASHRLERRWIGIDITSLATNLIRNRLRTEFPSLDVEIRGMPRDMDGARDLARQKDRYLFQDWAVFEAGGRPAGGKRKKGADRGIDGVIAYRISGNVPRRALISVKSGTTKPADIRDLAGVVARDDTADIGIFICLEEPTRAMVEESLSHGTWRPPLSDTDYQRIQIITARDLLDGKRPKIPGVVESVFARASKVGRQERGRQAGLDL